MLWNTEDGQLSRPAAATAGVLAGVASAVLTVVLPPAVARAGSPFYLGALFGNFIGDIFGVVMAAFFFVLGRVRSIPRLLAFVLACAIGYLAALLSTIFSAEAIGLAQQTTSTAGNLAGAPVLAFFLGGAAGAAIVLFAFFFLFSAEANIGQMLGKALAGTVAGGVLGALGWFLGPLLGTPLASFFGAPQPRVGPPSDTVYYYSIFFVLQGGTGLVLGYFLADEVNARDLHTQGGTTLERSLFGARALMSLKFVFFGVLLAAAVRFAWREFPEHVSSTRWHRAYNQHLAEKPSLTNLPDVPPMDPAEALLLIPISDLIPGRPIAGKQHVAADPKTGELYSAEPHLCGVTYALPGAPISGGNPGPHVDVEVSQYPSAAWAGTHSASGNLPATQALPRSRKIWESYLGTDSFHQPWRRRFLFLA